MNTQKEFHPVKRVKLGIIGMGKVFALGYKKWFAKYLKRDNFQLVAIAEKNAKLLKKYSEKYDCKGYEDGFDLLDNADINAILINTPTWTHAPLTIQAAKKGVHILCEKPLTENSTSSWDVVEMCKKYNVYLQVGLVKRFIPAFQKIKAIINEGVIGKIFEVEVDWPTYIPNLTKKPYKTFIKRIKQFTGIDLGELIGGWSLRDKSLGKYGGIFLDHAPHVLDLLRFCLESEVKAVMGTSTSLIEGRYDDTTKGILRFENDTQAYIRTSVYDFQAWLIARLKMCFRGIKGAIMLDYPNTSLFKSPKSLTLYRENPISNAMKIIETFGLFRGEKIRLRKNYMFLDGLHYFINHIRGTRMRHPVFGLEHLAARGEDGAIATLLVEKIIDNSELDEPSWMKIKYDGKWANNSV
ncbi:MAG: hypothetical protein GF383_00415 [Candidatus Lokiarchaeota archaeon]|nr:hypothetical protein [Candidatus Lokiarchaeota archaeon]MBD3337625.1 hypothetical protein [Candidatus Lokiarchaeota archaeon]